MIVQAQTTCFSSKQFKTLLLGGVAAVTSIIAVALSQPQSATAAVNGEHCETAIHDHPVANDAEYSRSSYAESRQQADDGKLFWNSRTKGWLTGEQHLLLTQTYNIGLEYGDQQFAATLQAVLLQETIAGQLGRIGHMTAPVGKRSYGVMQVKVSAARDVLRKHKEFGKFRSDEELIIALMTDDEFNIRIASRFLNHLISKTDSIEAALVAYNIGLRASRKISRPDEFKYVLRTQLNLGEVVQHFNKRFLAENITVAMRSLN